MYSESGVSDKGLFCALVMVAPLIATYHETAMHSTACELSNTL